MKHRMGPPFLVKSVFRDLLFFAFFSAALFAIVAAPLLAYGHSLEHASSIWFQGRQVNVATQADVGRRVTPSSPPGSTDPVPIPGGLVLPPQIHVFAPGPTNQGFQGLDVEPSVITNYRGFSAIAYPGGFGTATDNNGNEYDVITDMRVFQGEYISADGTHHRGTFAFI